MVDWVKLYEQLISGEDTGDLFKDEDFARKYDRSFGKDLSQYEAHVDLLLDLATYIPSDIIVDLGCGTGISTARILARNPYRIIRLDFSEPMLRQAREKFKDRDNVEFEFGCAEVLFTVVSGVDKVISVNVFQYLSDPNRVFQEVYRALNPDGEYLFNVTVKSSKQSIYFQMFEVLEQVLSEERGKDVEVPKPKGLELKYDRSGIETMAGRNGFVVERYDERVIVYSYIGEQLHPMHENFLAGVKSGLETIGQERANHIVERIRERFKLMYTPQGFVVGKEAYICLRKALNQVIN